jgi:hypothetical protein
LAWFHPRAGSGSPERSLPWSSGILTGASQKQLAYADILSLLDGRMLCCRMEVAQTPLQW